MPFSQSAHCYDAIYGPARDYRSQAAAIARMVRDRYPRARSLLDVACGTGLHLSHLSARFEVAGVDVSQAMVDLARKRNPGVPVECADMRSFQLGRRFDAVICLFSSITYAGTVAGLDQTLRTFAAHLNPGGVCIVEPYLPPTAWVDGVLGMRTGSQPGLAVAMVDRAVRDGRRVRREIGYSVSTHDAVDLINEVHEFMLFTRDEYAEAFRRAGFAVSFDEPGFDPARGLYVGTLPGS